METAALLIALGILFLAGLALDAIGRRVHVPRVTLLILLGALVGPPTLDILPTDVVEIDHILAPTALTMVAFLIGGTLERSALVRHGRVILIVSATVVILGAAVVAGGLVAFGQPLGFALLLGAIATATAPAAVQDVVRQSGARGPFAQRLLGIVAIDDAWGLLVFSAALTAAAAIAGEGDALAAMARGVWESGGAIVLGLAIGLPGAYLTGRIKPGEPTLIEALGIVFLTAGLAQALEVSYLLAGIVCGCTIVNLARHHEQPFHEIERIEWPFLLVFFVLAGASFETGLLIEAGAVCLLYIALRAGARIVGGLAGGHLAGLPPRESTLMGLALMPQAGVAIGMALVAADRMPEIGGQILTITVASTIAFEIFGPLLTQYALEQTEAVA
jgi:Kef-type K+ transport system membrane component KefB